jgi:hypothetical protein
MVGLDDVGVDQIRDELGFTDEIIDEHFLVRIALTDDLDGDPLDEIAGAVLFGLVNDTHAALEYLADDFVAEVALDRE